MFINLEHTETQTSLTKRLLGLLVLNKQTNKNFTIKPCVHNTMFSNYECVEKKTREAKQRLCQQLQDMPTISTNQYSALKGNLLKWN